MPSPISTRHVDNLLNNTHLSNELSEELSEELSVSSSQSYSDQKVIDLTEEGNLDKNTKNVTENVSKKTEKLNNVEFISLIFTLSFVPQMVIFMYLFFPMLTLLITIPWIPLLYKMKTYKSNFRIITNKDYINMCTITYHKYKESFIDLYNKIENHKEA